MIDGVDAILAESAHSFPRHWHDQFGVGVVLAGAQTSASGRGPVEAVAGDVITVSPGEVHDGTPIGSRGRRWSMLYFEPWRVADYAREIGEGAWGAWEFTRPVFTDRRVVRLASDLIAAMTSSSDPATELLREERALLVMERLLTRRDGAVAAASPPAAVRRAIALIDNDPSAPVSLADLAGVSGLSRFQVVRGISRATGLTPHAYILQRRLDLARQRIRGGMGLAAAAAACGFADQSHMTRLFKRRFGYPPGIYAAA